MMFWISPLLALIALVTVPVSVLVTTRDRQAVAAAVRRAVEAHRASSTATSRRCSPATRWSRSSAGRRVEPRRSRAERQAVRGQLPRPVHLRADPAAMMFIGNLNYVLVAVVGGLRVASGALSLGDVQAFIQYSRQFSQPLTQVASHGQPAAVRRRLGRAGLRAARRRGAEPGPPVAGPGPADRARPGRVRGRVVPLRAGQAADRGPVAGPPSPARPSRSSARPAPARPRWSTC
jgi:ATP-binding cassette subfamily B multidrug efflux pump